MASGQNKIEIKIAVDASSVKSGVAKATRELERINTAAGNSHRSFSALGKVAMVGAAAGLGAVALAAKQGFERLQAQEKVSAMTANTLKNMGGAAALTKGQVEEMAKSLALMSGKSKDSVQAAENLLLSMKATGTNAGMFKQAMTVAMDRSAKSGRDLSVVARGLGLALNDPTGSLGRLARAGVFLDSTTKEQIKTLAKEGKLQEARAMILDKVGGSAKGAAKAMGETTTGQVNRLKEALGQMEEEVAKALLPALLKMGPPLINLVHSLEPAFQTLAVGVGAVAGPLSAMTGAILGNTQALGALVAVTGTFVALSLGAKVEEAATAFRKMGEMTARTKIIGGLTSLVQTAGQVGGAFASAATGIGKFAPQATEFDKFVATPGRFAGAMSAAKTSISEFGTAASSAIGPGAGWMIGIAATTTLATVIGSDLVASFRSGSAEANNYADAVSRAGTSATNLKGVVGGLVPALDNLNAAVKREADARRAANADPGDVHKQVVLKQAIAATADARDKQTASLRNAARETAATAKASADQVASFAKHAAGYGLVARGSDAAAAASKRWSDAQKLASTQVGNTTDWKKAQASYATMADQLSKMSPKYAGVAKEALKLSDMKPGPGAQALADKIAAQLDKISGAAKKSKPTVTLKVEDSAANTALDNFKTKFDALEGRVVHTTIDTTTVQHKAGGGYVFAAGGVVHGPGGVDKVPAMLTSGEVVLNKRQQSMVNGGASINQALAGTGGKVGGSHFASGGYAAAGLVLDASQAVSARQAVRDLNQAAHDLKNAKDAAGRSSARSSMSSANDSFKSSLMGFIHSARDAFRTALGTDTVKRNGSTSQGLVNSLGGANSTEGFQSIFQQYGAGAILNLSPLTKLQRGFDAQMKSLDSSLANDMKGIDNTLQGGLKDVDSVLAGNPLPDLSKFSDTVKGQFQQLATDVANVNLKEALSPQEQALADFDKANAAADMAQRMQDAQQALSEAQQSQDPTQIAAAQRALAQVQRDQQRADMQAAADDARAQREKDLATAQTTLQTDAQSLRDQLNTEAETSRTNRQAQYDLDRQQAQDQYDALRIMADQSADDIGAGAEKAVVNMKASRQNLRKVLKDVKDDFKDYGDDAGKTYKTQLMDSLGGIGESLAQKLANELKPYLEMHSPADKGPLSEIDKWFEGFAPALVDGMDTKAVAQAGEQMAAMLSPGAPGGAGRGGGAVVINVQVNGNELSAKDFARKLQPELDRLVRMRV